MNSLMKSSHNRIVSRTAIQAIQPNVKKKGILPALATKTKGNLKELSNQQNLTAEIQTSHQTGTLICKIERSFKRNAQFSLK